MKHRIGCNVIYNKQRNDRGAMIPSVTAECSQCGHQTHSFGTKTASVKRCLVLMKDSCECDKDAFYYEISSTNHTDSAYDGIYDNFDREMPRIIITNDDNFSYSVH